MRRQKVSRMQIVFSFAWLIRKSLLLSLASMELSLLISSVIHRYDIEPLEPGKKVSALSSHVGQDTDFMFHSA